MRGRENEGGGGGRTSCERKRREGGRERERKRRGKSKPVNHEAKSAYVTGAGEAAENVMKFSEICLRLLLNSV